MNNKKSCESAIKRSNASASFKPDPFAMNLLEWVDEFQRVQPLLPKPVENLNEQPKPTYKVKQNRSNNLKN